MVAGLGGRSTVGGRGMPLGWPGVVRSQRHMAKTGIDVEKFVRWYDRGIGHPSLPRVTQIVVGHKNSDGKTQTIDAIQFADEQPLMEANDAYQQVNDSSTAWAENSGEGMHYFVLQMFHGKEQVPWDSAFPFMMMGRSPDAEIGEFGFSSEGPTGKGLMGQLMRHNEVLQGNFMKTVEFNQRFLVHVISQQGMRLDTMEKRHWDSVQLYEDLLDRRQERELKNLTENSKMVRMNRLYEVLYAIIPVIGAKVLGGNMAVGVLPKEIKNGGPAMDLVRSIMHTVTDEQIPNLMSTLKPDQVAAFMELYNMIKEEDTRRQEADEQARHMATTSRDDVHGAAPREASGGMVFGSVAQPKQIK